MKNESTKRVADGDFANLDQSPFKVWEHCRLRSHDKRPCAKISGDEGFFEMIYVKKTSACIMANKDTKYTQNNIMFDVTTFQGDICRVLHGWESHHKGDFSFSRHISKHLIFIRKVIPWCNASN